MLDFQVEYRDFGYGSGFLSPDNKSFYINVPKNASSFVSDWLHKSEWTSATVGGWGTTWEQIDSIIIVLRDPIDRWITGISQYIKSYLLDSVIGELPITALEFINDYNQISHKIIFDQPNMFDDHVWPQHCFFENILPDAKRTYFYVNKNLESNLKANLNLKTIDSNNLDYHKSSDDEELKILTEFFSSKVYPPFGDSKLYEKLKEIYKKDYELIDSVELIK